METYSAQPLNCCVSQGFTHIPHPTGFPSKTSSGSQYLLTCPQGCPEPAGTCPVIEAYPPVKSTSGKSQTAAVRRLGSNQRAEGCQYGGLEGGLHISQNLLETLDSCQRTLVCQSWKTPQKSCCKTVHFIEGEMRPKYAPSWSPDPNIGVDIRKHATF